MGDHNSGGGQDRAARCLIIVHPSGDLDDVGDGGLFWTEVPALPQCSMVEASSSDKAVELTKTEVRAWINGRSQGAWNPLPARPEFDVIEAW